jgi:hypothetical protein
METKHLARAEWLELVARVVGSKRLSPGTLLLLETGNVSITRDGVVYTTDPTEKIDRPTHTSGLRIQATELPGEPRRWVN